MTTSILVTQKEILKRYKPTNPNTHKGLQGHALLIGGSYGKMGSISLSAKAALKAGCGLVTAFIPKCGYQILQIGIPEVMVITDISEELTTNITFDLKPKAIGIGPGMGLHPQTQKAFHDFLKANRTALVVDADALNALAHNPDWVYMLPKKTILTPHLKELERLIGTWDSEEEKVQQTMAFSLKHEVIIVMKGAPTQIIDGDTVYQNTTGNAALATAGSGDVLTGMITSFLAQSYEPIDAAVLGVFIHGVTADLAVPELGYESFIASDIIATIGKAFLSIKG